jgi:hypothetical protein
MGVNEGLNIPPGNQRATLGEMFSPRGKLMLLKTGLWAQEDEIELPSTDAELSSTFASAWLATICTGPTAAGHFKTDFLFAAFPASLNRNERPLRVQGRFRSSRLTGWWTSKE